MTSDLLAASLEIAVSLRICELKQMGYIPSDWQANAQSTVNDICSRADELLYGGQNKGEVAKLFNRVACAIAVLAFQPGGINIFGFKAEATFPEQ